MLVLDRLHQVVRRGALLAGARSEFHTVAGRRMHAYDVPGRGAGPTLVLVHGLGATGHTWSAVLFALRRRWRRILVPDLPGHGFSTLAPGEAPLGVDALLDSLKAFVREVAGGPVVLVGNSLGGGLSAQFAIDEPALVSALGLVSPAGAPLGVEGVEGLKSGFGARNAAEVVHHLSRVMHRQSRVNWLLANDFLEHFRSPAIQHVLATAAPTDSLDPARLAALTQPTFLIWGASDRLLPHSGWEFCTRHLPAHARTELLAECGHMAQLERPGRTLAAIDRLADELEARDRPAS